MKGNWFLEHRLAWIKESVEVFDRINRDNIMRKFRISTPQASMDIAEAMRRWPDLMTYNRSAKRYERNVALPADEWGKAASSIPIGESDGKIQFQ